MTSLTYESDEELDNNRIEELDQPTVMTDLPIRINWANLPPGITVPQVNLHSIILDFSSVSFLDFSAMTVLRKVITIHRTVIIRKKNLQMQLHLRDTRERRDGAQRDLDRSEDI